MEGMYQRKDGGKRRKLVARELGCSYCGNIDACNRGGGLTNILADAITTIELSHRKRCRGNKGVPKFTKMKPPGPTSITGGNGKERLINCEYCRKSTTV